MAKTCKDGDEDERLGYNAGMFVYPPGRQTTRFLLGWVLLQAFLCGATGAAGRYSVKFEDGSRIEGNTLALWDAVNRDPTLDDRPLVNSSNPMQWFLDRAARPASPPPAFIEMISGDRLPGQVVRRVDENSTGYELWSAHFVVEPHSSLYAPGSTATNPPVRIVQRYVRRIAWHSGQAKRYQPGTAFFRDGRSTTFRALSFGETWVNVLLDAGRQKWLFDDLAEIHFPEQDFWDAYFDELAVLCPNGQSRLLQIETSDGLIATASDDRFSASVHGNRLDPSRWIHGLHPAWSLDPLWVRIGNVWMRRSFRPSDVPLSRVVATAVEQRSLLSGRGDAWHVNRNVRGGSLASGGEEFGWGFGVHAFAQLEFTLPAMARGFRTRVGLDAIAKEGGCVRACVYLDNTKTRLWESDFLVGSEKTLDSGVLQLVDSESPRKLILQIDPAQQGRPENADPLDIRDFADWLDPMVILDPATLARELRRRVPSQMLAWQGWEFSAHSDTDVRWLSVEQRSAPVRGTFETAVATDSQPFSLRRRLKLDIDDNWLMLLVDHVRGGKYLPEIEVLIDGKLVAELPIPLRARADEEISPLAVSLAEYRTAAGDEIELEIRQTRSQKTNPVRWYTVQITNQLPTLYPLFDDEGEFKPVEVAAGQGDATLHGEDTHSGVRSIKVTASGRFRREFAERIKVRETPDWGEYRYMRFAFRKFGGGRVSIELNHAGIRPVRYDAGLGEPSWGAANRVWRQLLPSQWIVITRDLYSDFGSLDITGLTLSTPDGSYALFDHIYLARSPEDFSAMRDVPSPVATNQKARRELVRPILEKGMPATVAIDCGEGRFGTGVLVSGDGYVLTAGHVVCRPDREVTVRLADGRVVSARTRGVHREADIGLLKITDKGPFPFVGVSLADEIPFGQLYVGIAHQRAVSEAARPAAHIVDIQRVFRGAIWTSFDLDDFSTGGPFLDGDGRLIGIHSKRSNAGGFLYARLNEVVPHLDRLKNGEVWGKWSAGTGPMIGVEITTVKEGCKVTGVFEGTAAERAGFQVGDIIQKMKDRSVVSLDDIFEILADNDAGQEVDVEILRGEQIQQAKLKLQPRVP